MTVPSGSTASLRLLDLLDEEAIAGLWSQGFPDRQAPETTKGVRRPYSAAARPTGDSLIEPVRLL